MSASSLTSSQPSESTDRVRSRREWYRLREMDRECWSEGADDEGGLWAFGCLQLGSYDPRPLSERLTFSHSTAAVYTPGTSTTAGS